MRSPHHLVHSRARLRQRYALFPLAGIPTSRLPTWPDAEVRVLAAPALGAQFVQYLIDLPSGGEGGFEGSERIETFFFILSGSRAGSFGLIEPGTEVSWRADDATRLLVVRKRYERMKPSDLFAPVSGHESDVKAEPFAENPHTRLQTLIPDDLRFDLAMNIFTFDPGHGLPYVETHVMEHGLLMLEGKGMYYLDGEWMEVEKDDYVWMGSYCPQSFYATGPTPAKYIYYKNVNREIEL